MKFSEICAEVEKTMDGIFRSYRLDAVEVEEDRVTAKVTNTWKDKNETVFFNFRWRGGKLNAIEYCVLELCYIWKEDASTKEGIAEIVNNKVDELFCTIQKEHGFESGDLLPEEAFVLEEIQTRLVNFCMDYIGTKQNASGRIKQMNI